MASAVFVSNTVANAQANATNILMNSGVLNIYSNSTTKPVNANTAVTGGAAILATLILPAYTQNTVSASGTIVVGTIPATTGLLTGTASYCRLFQSNGTTPLIDGNVRLAAATPDLVLDNTTITSGLAVDISGFTYIVTE